MPEIDPAAAERVRARTLALSRWENEGGARLAPISADAPPPSGAEADHLRLIALENIVIALPAGADDCQRALIREMADYISPRPGYTRHPLTLGAAGEMRSLLDRADRFRPGTDP